MQPLSDRERQILNDIEARLREDDPKFARVVGTGAARRGGPAKVKLAIAGFVVGLVMLFGIVAHFAWGLAGFVLMLASAVYGGNHFKQAARQAQAGLGGQLRGGLHRYLDARRAPREDDSST